MKVSKDLNATFSALNEVYRQVIYAAQPYIFQIENKHYKYNELKNFIDNRLWFVCGRSGKNHVFFHSALYIADKLLELMVLISSALKIKNLSIDDTFRNGRMIIENEVFKMRTHYKMTELKSIEMEREFEQECNSQFNTMTA